VVRGWLLDQISVQCGRDTVLHRLRRAGQAKKDHGKGAKGANGKDGVGGD